MGYVYILGSYCFTFEQFEYIVKKNVEYMSVIHEWLKPLIEDGILIQWLSSLGHIKADNIVELIQKSQSISRNTDNIIRRLCCELDS